jgi:hypothetical protein
MKYSTIELKYRLVHFKIRDVYIPDAQMLLLELYGDDLLQGKVLDISDSGSPEGAFAVVKVEGLEQPVIVPVERIRGVV